MWPTIGHSMQTETRWPSEGERVSATSRCGRAINLAANMRWPPIWIAMAALAYGREMERGKWAIKLISCYGANETRTAETLPPNPNQSSLAAPKTIR